MYELALIPAIFGLDWIGSAKMDPCPTLMGAVYQHRLLRHAGSTYNTYTKH